MLSRIPVRSTLILLAVAPLVTPVPASSNDLPSRMASTTWYSEKSVKAKKVPSQDLLLEVDTQSVGGGAGTILSVDCGDQQSGKSRKRN